MINFRLLMKINEIKLILIKFESLNRDLKTLSFMFELKIYVYIIKTLVRY